MKEELLARLKKALEKDPFIICKPEQFDKHPGRPLEYLEGLGLLKSDLKRLERLKMAIRARYWDTPTMEYRRNPGSKYCGGHRLRWILLDIGGANGEV